jgi:hypothetical protein
MHFSVWIFFNAKDEMLITILKEILDKYNLETNRLNEDVQACYNDIPFEEKEMFEDSIKATPKNPAGLS